MFNKFFLALALIFFNNISFANSEIKIPELVGRVMFEGSLQPTDIQKEALLTALRDLEKENKVQMGILVVDSIKPYSIEEYSIMVADKWKVGQKGIDNGVLMVVATKDRKARLEVGNGLQGSLTDAMTKRIQMEKMVPEFKKGRFVEGIIATVEGIKSATVVEIPVITNAIEVKKAKQASEEISPVIISIMIFTGVAGVFGIIAYFVIQNSKNKEAERKRLEAGIADYNRRQNPYASKASNDTNTEQNDYATRLAAQRRREAEYARQNANSAPSLNKSRPTSSSTNSTVTKKKSSSSSSNDDDTPRKSTYSGSTSGRSSSSTKSSNDEISGGGSFNGGGSSSEW